MRAVWKIACLSTVIFAAALGLAHLLVPDVVPVGYADEPQPSWAVLTRSVLPAVELTAAWVAIIALALLAGAKLRQMFRRTASRAG